MTQILLWAEQKTIGALLDHIEGLDADGRRQLLDEARVAAGLDTVADEEAHARFEDANSPAAQLGRRLHRGGCHSPQG